MTPPAREHGHAAPPMLAVRGVIHRRGGREVLAIEELDVAWGERIAVLGPNGAGKTTLLRLLAAVEPPTTGQVLVDGADPAALRRGELLALRRRIGHVPQRPALLAGTVVGNVELPLSWRKVEPEARHARARAALDRLGVGHLARRRTDSLSGGEAQRVALARALVTDPKLLLLDEPAAALDADARAAFLTDVEQVVADRQLTLVHVTHRAEEALQLVDRVVVLVAGHVRQASPSQTVLSAPVDATVAKILGYHNLLDVVVDDAGAVRLGELTLLPKSDIPPGQARLAVWASEVSVAADAAADGATARVASVRQGPGRWEIRLHAAGQDIAAHLPLSEDPPRPGAAVGVSVDPAAARVLGRPSHG